MFVADFLNIEKNPYIVKINFLEYITAKLSSKIFLKRLSKKFNLDFNKMYYGGVRICY